MNILYVCTHNRCRSILSEAITNHQGGARLRAASAGSSPAPSPHPLAISHLARRGIPTEGLFSKSWDQLTDFTPDLVVTLCDRAAAEQCPAWLGSTPRIHWGLSDPSALIDPSPAEQDEAFEACLDEIQRRVKLLAEIAGHDDWRSRLGSLVDAAT